MSVPARLLELEAQGKRHAELHLSHGGRLAQLEAYVQHLVGHIDLLLQQTSTAQGVHDRGHLYPGGHLDPSAELTIPNSP